MFPVPDEFSIVAPVDLRGWTDHTAICNHNDSSSLKSLSVRQSLQADDRSTPPSRFRHTDLSAPDPR